MLGKFPLPTMTDLHVREALDNTRVGLEFGIGTAAVRGIEAIAGFPNSAEAAKEGALRITAKLLLPILEKITYKGR